MTTEKTTSHQLLKSINQQKVLHLIFAEGPISRVELADKTGLTQQTVTNIVNRLLLEDTVVEGTPGASSGGRKPVPLTINVANMFAIGIELAGKYVQGALHNFRYDLVGEARRPVDRYMNEDHILATVCEVIDELLQLAPERSRIKGIGLSIQGLVDSKQGIALRLPGIGWGRFPLQERLENKYDMPFYLENDVNLLAINENMHGSLRGSSNNITLKFDYGIGGAIVAHNQLVTGSTFVAGEFGHYKSFTGANVYRCHCGGTGCLTTLASTSGLAKNAGLTLDEFAEGVRTGEPRMAELYETVVTALCLAVSNVVTFLNPDQVLMTGKMLESLGDLLIPAMDERIMANVPETCRGVRLNYMRQKPDESALGAGLVLKRVFEVPVDSLSL
ncbi:ROK family protein [Paenibacillus sp. LMG 31458]|uniref:ROK family protein n=1 Tax=Paenibacillus phytorum TaxID=2654977 RepID=A0ABX1Y219_9BACL|nr:ROK family transcriptional regulator [Paenibacillus phytorum]NOU74907.1 ROK family protein [Paenibacillus phytorum]